MTAGFILGFDSEKGSVADSIVELIEEAAIPVCMVGLLYALPNTQLTRRLASEGRLHPDLLLDPAAGMDQCTQGLNSIHCGQDTIFCSTTRWSSREFTSLSPTPSAFNVWPHSSENQTRTVKCVRTIPEAAGGLEVVHRVVSKLLGAQNIFRRTIIQCASSNPQWARTIRPC